MTVVYLARTERDRIYETALRREEQRKTLAICARYTRCLRVAALIVTDDSLFSRSIKRTFLLSRRIIVASGANVFFLSFGGIEFSRESNVF